MPEALLETWQERGVEIVQGYGLTEAAPNVLCLPPEDAARKRGFAGKPYPHVDVALRDPETGRLVDAAAEGELVRYIELLADEADGFVLSDYGQGTVTQAVAGTVIRLAEGRYVGLDSRHRLLDYPGVTAATPNLEETEEATGLRLSRRDEIEAAGASLRAKLGAEALLVTLGAGGMSLFEPNAEPVHVPVANKSEVFDVTGAGDTVVAAFTLARLSGGSYLEAAHLANVAGGISVRHSGATPVKAKEVRDALGG